jgi:nicotinate dehydrogenase subunit A
VHDRTGTQTETGPPWLITPVIANKPAIPGGRFIMNQKFTLNVNGTTHSIDADPDMPLLYALRDNIGLNNPHFGCGVAQCGACTVHMDGQPIRSCATTVSSVGDALIVTLSGLGTPEKPHPLQTAYIQEQVPQCGYCVNGWIMTAAAFLKDRKRPTDAEIKDALQGLKCRCGTHVSILKAVRRAAEMMG